MTVPMDAIAADGITRQGEDSASITATAPARGTRPYTFCRYALAGWMMPYGFAKVFGVQFITPPSVADMPLGQVRDVMLAWYFYGSEPAYTAVIALAEIAAAALLLFRRTALAGALMMLGLLLNILLVDVFYAITGPIVSVLIMLGMCAYILSWHRDALIGVLRGAAEGVYGREPRRFGVARTAAVWLLRAGTVALPATAMWRLRQQRDAPLPLEGRWTVRSAREAKGDSGSSPLAHTESIYFERWHGPVAVFRHGETFHRASYTADTVTHTLRIREDDPLRKTIDGPLLFDGHYTRTGDGLLLDGTAAGTPLRLELVPTSR
ncbi:MAG TPA: hypothetical protein VFJ16_28975 [Longimicrobium sp.]|nr:hypothetical protein [Longimicrobium sp.]